MSDPKKQKPAKLPPMHELGLLDCMKTANGRAFVWDLLESSGCFRISADLVSGPLAPYATYFREGERNNGNKLLHRIQAADLDGYLKMQREALLRASNDDNARERNRAAEYGSPAGDDGDGDNGSGGDGND